MAGKGPGKENLFFGDTKAENPFGADELGRRWESVAGRSPRLVSEEAEAPLPPDGTPEATQAKLDAFQTGAAPVEPGKPDFNAADGAVKKAKGKKMVQGELGI